MSTSTLGEMGKGEPPVPSSGTEEPPDPAMVAEWARRGRAVLIHTVALGAFLVALRVQKIWLQEFDVGFFPYLQALSAEILLLLLLEAPWFLTIRIAPQKTRWWATLYIAAHLPIYLLTVLSHRFFLESGIIPKWEVMRYAMREFSTLHDLLATGVDEELLLLLLKACACMLCVPLALRLLPKQKWGASIAIPASMTLFGASLVLIPAPNNIQLITLGGNWLTDLLPDQAVQEYLTRSVPVHAIYSAPTLVPHPVPEAASARPNFLIIGLESTRTDLLAAYTGKASLSPFVDELAARSVIVDDAYTTISHTSKALVGILCGMSALPVMPVIEARPNGLPLACLPQLLKQAGYATGFFQSAGNFEHRDGLLSNMGFEHKFIPSPREGAGFYSSGYLGWDERVMLRPAAEWMAKAKRPFFATLLTVSTHHPYDSPGAGPARSWQTAEQHYERAARYVDDQLRLLFEQLERDGTLQNTVVIMMGDHGEAFDEKPGFRQHDRAPYDTVTHVPLFVYAPQLFQPQHLGGLRQQTDILPTVLELAHLSWKGQLPGSGLFSSPGHSQIITSCWYPNSCLSLRSENHSFVFHFGHLPLQAFDLATDPAQQHDVAALVPAEVQDQAIDLMLGEMASVRRYYESALHHDPDN